MKKTRESEACLKQQSSILHIITDPTLPVPGTP